MSIDCSVCGEEAKFQCKRCKSVRYCSDECKGIGWKQGHKEECQPKSIDHIVGSDGEPKLYLKISKDFLEDVPDEGSLDDDRKYVKIPTPSTVAQLVEMISSPLKGTIDHAGIYEWKPVDIFTSTQGIWTKNGGFEVDPTLDMKTMFRQSSWDQILLLAIVYGVPVEYRARNTKPKRISSIACVPQPMPVGEFLEDLPAELVMNVASMHNMTVQDIEAFSKTLGNPTQAHAKGLFASDFWVFIQQPKFWQAIVRDRHTQEEIVPFQTLAPANTPNWTPDWKWVAIALEVEKDYAINGRYAEFTRPPQVATEEEERGSSISFTQAAETLAPGQELPMRYFIINYIYDKAAHPWEGRGSLDEVSGHTAHRGHGFALYRGAVRGLFGGLVFDESIWGTMRRWMRLFIYKLLREGYYWQDNQGRRISSEMLVGQSTCPPQPMPGVISKRKMTFGKELGKGAFGVVRAGTYLGKPVAIKTIQGTPTPEAIKDFSEEARLLGNIKPHPNVVQFIGITRDPLMLVTELVKGGALDSRLKRGKPPVQWTDVMRWARDIARGMRHLHNNNILHRDLATRNVLLDSKGTAKVTDFGLSRRICTRDKELRFRQQEFFRGPYKWMPPESMAANDFSVKSDVWAYGVTLWEIMSRRAPFEFVDINYVKHQVINSGMRLPLPTRWPQRLNDLMLSCWNPNPNSRPNMLAISTILKAIGDSTYNRRPLPAISDGEIRTLYQ